MSECQGCWGLGCDMCCPDPNETYIEMDSKLIAESAVLGLCEFKDGCWQPTERGVQVWRNYFRRQMEDQA